MIKSGVVGRMEGEKVNNRVGMNGSVWMMY